MPDRSVVPAIGGVFAKTHRDTEREADANTEADSDTDIVHRDTNRDTYRHADCDSDGDSGSATLTVHDYCP
jgi:hypothetical protein